MIKLCMNQFLYFDMTGTYKFIDHTADIAAEVSAENYNDLFIASAYVWKESVVEDFSSDKLEEKEIEISDRSLEELLVHFLSELNYLLLVKGWIFSEVKEISVEESENQFEAKLKILGEPVDENKHILKIEIKAVTFHQMNIKYGDGKYRTRIVFDI